MRQKRLPKAEAALGSRISVSRWAGPDALWARRREATEAEARSVSSNRPGAVAVRSADQCSGVLRGSEDLALLSMSTPAAMFSPALVIRGIFSDAATMPVVVVVAVRDLAAALIQARRVQAGRNAACHPQRAAFCRPPAA